MSEDESIHQRSCFIGKLFEEWGPEKVAFDLASLTKALVTSPLAIRNLEAVREWLGENLSEVLTPTALDPLNLLSHTSGLVPWLSFYATDSVDRMFSEFIELSVDQRRERVLYVLRRASQCKSLFPLKSSSTQAKSVYSDVGLILLGVALENALGRSLEGLKRDFCTSIGDDQSVFFSVENIASLYRYPSSGLSGFSGVNLSGLVQDENCRFLGMECGHSGLFATGPALGQYIRKLVGSKEGLKMLRLSAGLDPSTIPEFSVGFRKSDDPTSSLLFSHSHALGHYGYTGTSFWINPENLRYHILLCNRLHKGKRDAAPMREFRSRVYRLHKESLEIS